MQTRPRIMGILNITPDSFSGDGLLCASAYVEAAIGRAESMVADGADILDIGGESTRPGATPVGATEEKLRVVPVIRALRARFPDLMLSIDTMKAEVALAALEAGATMINDVSGDATSDEMLRLAAQSGFPLVLMHNRALSHAIVNYATAGNAYDAHRYEDVVTAVVVEMEKLAERAMSVGVERNKIILDPGIGFGKSLEDNLRLINGVDRIKTLGLPVLIGASRKNFIGRVLDAPTGERLEGDAAVTAVAVLRGADIVRVHDVRFMSRVARMAAALRDVAVS